jgi:glutaredoxin
MLAKVPSLASSSEFSELYTMEGCAACKSSITKLIDAGYEFDIIHLDDHNMKQAFEVWEHRLGKNPNSVPQFWYKDQYIGGSVEIAKFIKDNDVT